MRDKEVMMATWIYNVILINVFKMMKYQLYECIVLEKITSVALYVHKKMCIFTVHSQWLHFSVIECQNSLLQHTCRHTCNTNVIEVYVIKNTRIITKIKCSINGDTTDKRSTVINFGNWLTIISKHLSIAVVSQTSSNNFYQALFRLFAWNKLNTSSNVFVMIKFTLW